MALMAKLVKRSAYALEKLYEDQDPGYVIETVPHLVFWLDPELVTSSHQFEVRHVNRRSTITHEITVSWRLDRLAERDDRLHDDLCRYRNGKTLTREDRAKYAAYGLALVAISCLLQRRVIDIAFYRAPDLLLDNTAGALRGVEVAGRSSGGFSALAQASDGDTGKRAQLQAKDDVVEVYLSLWCREPKVSIWEKVKPWA